MCEPDHFRLGAAMAWRGLMYDDAMRRHHCYGSDAVSSPERIVEDASSLVTASFVRTALSPAAVADCCVVIC